MIEKAGKKAPFGNYEIVYQKSINDSNTCTYVGLGRLKQSN